MALASEILTRAHESKYGPFPELDDRTLVKKFLAADKELGLLKKLKGLNAADQVVSTQKNAILIFDQAGRLEVRAFRDATDALRELFELERQRPERDMVLVRADTSQEVRLAFKNYFSDASDFIRLVEKGCEKLSHTKMLKTKAGSH
jgi:putative GTP pyrophosphokinase